MRTVEFFDAQTSDFSPLFSQGQGLRRAVHGRHPVARLERHLRQAVARRAGSPWPTAASTSRAWTATSATASAASRSARLAANFAVRAPLTPKTVPFFDEFKKRTNRSPVYTAFGANDAVYIYAEAVKRAGTTNADAVIKELEKTSYVGIPGTIEFDENHDVKPGSATYKGPALLFAQWQRRLQARGDRAEGAATARCRRPG